MEHVHGVRSLRNPNDHSLTVTISASVHTLRGHTSTVRCLKMSNANTAISGSRDTTLRVWDLPSGTCTSVLMGHQASVRCLEIHGDLIVSGSYDTTAKIWSISTGQCLRTLQGHFSQIYAIAFDGQRIATGSLDTSVRIWNPHDGYELLWPPNCPPNLELMSLAEPAKLYSKVTRLSSANSKCAPPLL